LVHGFAVKRVALGFASSTLASTLRGLHDNLRGGLPGPVAHQQRGLPGRNQALGSVGSEGGAGRIESKGAQAAALEEAVLASHRTIACSTVGQVRPVPLLVMTGISVGHKHRRRIYRRLDLPPRAGPATWLHDAISGACRQAGFRKWRSSFFTV
jgi:hypothetical protein